MKNTKYGWLRDILHDEHYKNMAATGKLFKRLPMKYWDTVKKLEEAGDLTDDCKYILIFNEGYTFCGCETVPVKSITEAISFIKDACFME